MTTAGPESSSEKPLCLWPGVAGSVIVVFARRHRAVRSGGRLIGVLVGAAGAALIVLWWLFFSHAAWLERIGASRTTRGGVLRWLNEVTLRKRAR